ncbi:MAG: exodeoxyribonuclease VII small subunit [Myxococcota bacterium]|jgi:exodeoxyribonuclease VII small subunit
MVEETPGFEGALQELEKRVRLLEAGDLSLEQALALFEEGVELAHACHERLEAAEQRVSKLVRGPDGISEQPVPDGDR